MTTSEIKDRYADSLRETFSYHTYIELLRIQKNKMWEQHESLKFRMFGNSSEKRRPSTSGLTSKGQNSSNSCSSSSSSKNSSTKKDSGFVSRLGFRFDVANFDINAVSPTSW